MFRPKHEAARRIKPMLAQVKLFGRKPDMIPLSDYADAETFRFLLPKPGWSFDQWRQVNNEVAKQLRALGFNVQLVRLEMSEYMDWLVRYHLQNTPANRAQYVAWLVVPEQNKPLPDAPG